MYLRSGKTASCSNRGLQRSVIHSRVLQGCYYYRLKENAEEKMEREVCDVEKRGVCESHIRSAGIGKPVGGQRVLTRERMYGEHARSQRLY